MSCQFRSILNDDNLKSNIAKPNNHREVVLNIQDISTLGPKIFVFGKCWSVTTTWWSYFKAQLMAQIFRAKFVTSVSFILFCGGYFSCAMKLSTLSITLFENHCLLETWLCFHWRLCLALQICLDIAAAWKSIL